MEGTFTVQPRPRVSRGDQLISLFPLENPEGVRVGRANLRLGYVGPGSTEGHWHPTTGGTASQLSGTFSMAIPMTLEGKQVPVLWNDAMPIDGLDLVNPHSAGDWNSLIQLRNGETIGYIEVIDGEVWYVGAKDPIEFPGERKRLTPELLTGMTSRVDWTQPW